MTYIKNSSKYKTTCFVPKEDIFYMNGDISLKDKTSCFVVRDSLPVT